MRTIFIFIALIFVTGIKAQKPLPGNFQNNSYGSSFSPGNNIYDSGAQKKWSVNRYSGITTGYSFFNHGHSGFVAAPIGLQLNRRLNNNVYAFAGVTLAPAYLGFYPGFFNTKMNNAKISGSTYQPGNLALYSTATFGIVYINPEKKFSVSGSISIEKNRYPVRYNNFFNSTSKPINNIPGQY